MLTANRIDSSIKSRIWISVKSRICMACIVFNIVYGDRPVASMHNKAFLLAILISSFNHFKLTLLSGLVTVVIKHWQLCLGLLLVDVKVIRFVDHNIMRVCVHPLRRIRLITLLLKVRI